MAERTPEPIDRAYSDAEKLLHDEAERSARRVRILAAVAQDHAIDRASGRKQAPRFAFRGGWLVAASVLIVSGFLVTRFLALQGPSLSPPAAHAPVPKNDRMAAASPSTPAISQPDLAPALPKVAPPDHASAMARNQAEASGKEASLPAPEAPAAMAAPPPAAAPPPPPAMAAPRAAMDAPLAAPPPPAPARSLSADMAKPMGELAPDVDRLGTAAAAGRTAEVLQLLDRHVPVDAADAKGETALMKSIRADQPGTAALLIRHGASLDKKNSAGFSARDLAAQINDPALNRALGLEP